MRTTYKKVFSNKRKLLSMLEMRMKGWTYVSLATFFGVDHSSIYHECKKFEIKKKGNVSFNPVYIVSNIDLPTKKVKTSYADYLNESRKRTSNISQMYSREKNI